MGRSPYPGPKHRGYRSTNHRESRWGIDVRSPVRIVWNLSRHSTLSLWSRQRLYARITNWKHETTAVLDGATGGIALLSGCTFGGDDSDTEGSDDGVPPKVPQIDEQRWTKVDESSDENVEGFGPVDVTAYTRTHYWENEELRERLNTWTLDNFDQTVMMFFASRIEFEGIIKSGVRVSDIEEQALDEFDTQLENHDLRSITTTSSTEEMPDLGFRSASHEYHAEYPVPNFSREMDIEGVGNRTIELETGPLSVTGLISIWRDGSATGYVAGGIYPSE